MKFEDLKGLVAVICGASGHVGADVARVFASHGASVVVQYRSNAATAEKVADTIQKEGGEACALYCDALSIDSVNAFYQQVVDKYGRFDILVNAIHEQAGMVNVSEMEWDADWGPHIRAAQTNFYLCKYALPYLRESDNGRIIYISGGLSKRHFPGTSAYSAMKGGINNFCRTLALEEAEYGTTVNIVAPGRVEPSAQVEQKDELWEENDSNWGDYSTPIKRNVTAWDVGETAVYFASPASACITGQTIYVASGEIMP